MTAVKEDGGSFEAVPSVEVLSEVLFGASSAANEALLPLPHRPSSDWLHLGPMSDTCQTQAPTACESLGVVGGIAIDELLRVILSHGAQRFTAMIAIFLLT